jgi:NTP pyrophosphatase (non-canonical NTP hydrolase)
MKRKKILQDIVNERKRQDAKWGEQNHDPFAWLTILGEEYGEACKAALEAHFDGYEITGDYSDYRKELIETAAVVVAAIECLDRSSWGKP